MSENDDITESSPVDELEQQDAPAEAEKTESAVEEDRRIPYARFKEVIDARNELQSRLDDLEAKMAATSHKDSEEPPAPPPGASQLEQVRFYVEQFSKPYVEKALGMPLAEARKILESASHTAKSYAETQWENLCSRHGLDPKNKELQGVVAGLSRVEGMSVPKALEKAAQWFNAKPTPKEAARVEEGGVSGVLTQTDWIPKDAREAAEGAKKGRLAKQLSSVEVIQRSLEREAARGK